MSAPKGELPFNDFCKSKLKQGDHGVENPISQPLLIIYRRLGLNCPDGSITAKIITINATISKILNIHR